VAQIMPPSKFEQLQMQVIELASRMHAIQQRLAELTIPSAAEVEELKAGFRTASTSTRRGSRCRRSPMPATSPPPSS
jgi:hypothetical protein